MKMKDIGFRWSWFGLWMGHVMNRDDSETVRRESCYDIKRGGKSDVEDQKSDG